MIRFLSLKVAPAAWFAGVLVGANAPTGRPVQEAEDAVADEERRPQGKSTKRDGSMSFETDEI
jgi:hypothetical protein